MAPRDDDKAMAGMLRRTLASSSAFEGPISGNDCPPADLLAAYYEHSLGEDESARYDLHFSQCARCREQLAAMVRAEEPPQQRTNWAWLWSPYLLAPAVAVLALAVFFGVRHSAQTTAINQPSAAPLVAMSQPGQPSSQEMAAPKPAAPIAANGNANVGQPQEVRSASSEFDSLSKTKQAPLAGTPSASQDAAGQCQTCCSSERDSRDCRNCSGAKCGFRQKSARLAAQRTELRQIAAFGAGPKCLVRRLGTKRGRASRCYAKRRGHPSRSGGANGSKRSAHSICSPSHHVSRPDS